MTEDDKTCPVDCPTLPEIRPDAEVIPETKDEYVPLKSAPRPRGQCPYGASAIMLFAVGSVVVVRRRRK